MSGALLTANRDRLATCVDGVGEAARELALAREHLIQALEQVARHPQYIPAGLGGSPPVVDLGCPHPPYLLEPGVVWEDGKPVTGAGRVVEEASRYRLFVFLLGPADLGQAIRGDRDSRTAAQEMLCRGHQCVQVTTGLYLMPEEAADEPFLVAWLLKGLGLAPVQPPTNGSAPGSAPPDETSAVPPAPAEVWQYVAPERYTIRVAAHGQVVVAAAAPAFPAFHSEERFITTLARRWRVPLPCVPLYPAVDDERVYLPCDDGRIRAWNLNDGTEAWNLDTQAAPVVIVPAGNLLLVADGDPDDGYDLGGVDPPRVPDGRVRAVDAGTGALRWELLLHRESAYLTLAGAVLYVATRDRTAHGETLAVNPVTGDVLWRTPTGAASSRPFATADAVFVAASTGGLQRLSARDGQVQWQQSVPGGDVFQAPVAVGAVVVAGTNVNAIYELSAVDGVIRGRRDVCDCGYDAVLVENLVLVAGAGLTLLDPVGLRVVWEDQRTMGVAMPAVADGWVFAPAGHVLRAVRMR